MTACVENVIGRLLVRFLVVNSLISNASELGYSLVMLLFTQKKRQILVPDMAIDIIYIQVRASSSSFWLGLLRDECIQDSRLRNSSSSLTQERFAAKGGGKGQILVPDMAIDIIYIQVRA